MSSITSLARIGANSFHTVKCDESRMPDGFFYVKNDDAPEWVVELVQSIHEGRWFDDYTYFYIVESLEAIADESDEDQARGRVGDATDQHTPSLRHWLDSSVYRNQYVEDYLESQIRHCIYKGEYNEDITLSNVMSGGQWAERDEVFHQVLSTLQDLAE